MTEYLYHLVFGIYPYAALSVFLIGSLVRFDREHYNPRALAAVRHAADDFDFDAAAQALDALIQELSPQEVTAHG